MTPDQTFYFDVRNEIDAQEIKSFVQLLPQNQVGKLLRALSYRFREDFGMLSDYSDTKQQCIDLASAANALNRLLPQYR